MVSLSLYFLPLLMRPIDTVMNFKKYSMGFLAFLLMLPVFTTIFQTYAMCNLHDVSWGNRPSSSGKEVVSSKMKEEKKQRRKTAEDYQAYRTKFVLFWLLGNVIYSIVILSVDQIEGTAKVGDVKDSDSGYLMTFSLYLASLVAFRCLFASLYMCKWKCRYHCKNSYKVDYVNLHEELEKIKK